MCEVIYLSLERKKRERLGTGDRGTTAYQRRSRPSLTPGRRMTDAGFKDIGAISADILRRLKE